MTEPWPEERLERLARLYAEGRSMLQIAAELGGGVTKNAVIGKVHRLGLKRSVATMAAHTMHRDAEAGPDRSSVSSGKGPGPKQDERSSDPADLRHGGAERRETSGVTGGGDLALVPPPPVQPIAPVVAAPAERALFGEFPAARAVNALTLSTCRWPLGDARDPDFRFCCERVAVDGKPYCGAHALGAYNGTARQLTPFSRTGAPHGRAA